MNIYTVSLANTVGDACVQDYDNDGVHDEYDTCPNVASISMTSFEQHILVDLGDVNSKEPPARWYISNMVISLTYCLFSLLI